MFLQLDPALPVTTPKGKALCHLIIDYGIESDIYWVCFQDDTGECWTWNNKDIRAQKNITAGREYISPFYEPEDVAFNSTDIEWISVQDRLPDEGVLVLVYLPNDPMMTDYIVLCDKPIWAKQLIDDQFRITHWMPLPQSPEKHGVD